MHIFILEIWILFQDTSIETIKSIIEDMKVPEYRPTNKVGVILIVVLASLYEEKKNKMNELKDTKASKVWWLDWAWCFSYRSCLTVTIAIVNSYFCQLLMFNSTDFEKKWDLTIETLILKLNTIHKCFLPV